MIARSILVVAMLVASAFDSALAVPITFEFSGVVDWSARDDVVVGELFEGFYTFDSAAPGSSGPSDPNWTNFWSSTPETRYWVGFEGGVERSQTIEADIHVVHRAEYPSYESWGVRYMDWPLNQMLEIDFVTGNGRLLETGVLPLTPPEISHYQSRSNFVLDRSVSGSIMSMTVVVPEPSIAVLIGLGLIVISRRPRSWN